jgi:nitroreductase
MDLKDFFSLAESRRSVRKFTGEKVPAEVIEKCLDAALLAPNSSNLQPWQFYWVQTPEKKKKLVEYCYGQSAASTAAELIVCVARPDLWRQGQEINLQAFRTQTKPDPKVLEYYQKLIPFVYFSDPFGILGTLKALLAWVMGLRKVSYRGPFGRTGNLIVASKTTALACENFMLAVRAAGFDTCPMEGFDQTRVRKLLNLPCQAYVTMVIGVGQRAEGGIYGPRIRGDRQMFIYRI